MKVSQYKERLVTEESQLALKLTDLEFFLETPIPQSFKVEKHEFKLICDQLKAMKKYQKILKERIDLKIS